MLLSAVEPIVLSYAGHWTTEALPPGADLAIAVRRAIDIPVAMLVRQRTGPFTVSDEEFEEMKRQIDFAHSIGMDIVVLGILHPDRTVDVQRTLQLVQLAHPMQVTFHRAFDETPGLDDALQAVLQTGASRLLTSGASSSAVSGASVVDRLQHHGRRSSFARRMWRHHSERYRSRIAACCNQRGARRIETARVIGKWKRQRLSQGLYSGRLRAKAQDESSCPPPSVVRSADRNSWSKPCP